MQKRRFILAIGLVLVGFSPALAAGGAAMRQASETTTVLAAFNPPKIDFKKICVWEKDETPINLATPEAKLSVKEKTALAKLMLSGNSKVFPNPVKAIRLIQEIMKTPSSQADWAKYTMARMYMTGQFVEHNDSKAEDLLTEVAQRDPYMSAYHLGKLYERRMEFSKAEAYYKRSAAAGNPAAYLELAYLYRDNEIEGGTQQRVNDLMKLAESLLLERIGRGDCRAFDFVSKIFRDDKRDTQNYAQGMRWLEAAADSGSVLAKGDLGQIYLYGINVPQDEARGLQYYVEAARLNDAQSLYDLGMYWLNSRDPSAENRLKAVALLHKSADQGHQDSIIKLVEFYRGVYGDAPQYEKAAAQMSRAVNIPDINPKIPFMLGEAYSLGQGVPQDDAKAFEMYEEAAKQNYTEAVVKLGDAYKYGVGVSRLPVKSYRFYRQAGSVGNRDAMLALIDGYECGIGKPVNNKYAEFWRQRAINAGAGKTVRPAIWVLMASNDPKERTEGFLLLKRRASQGFRQEMVILSNFYSRGIAVEKDEAMAQKLIDQAIAPGETQHEGLIALGQAYLNTEMMGMDVAKAESYFKLAMEQGAKDAGYELGKIYEEKALKNPEAQTEAMKYYRVAAKLGNENAMRRLALIMLQKGGHDAEAIQYLENSAALHNIDAIISLVDYYMDKARDTKDPSYAEQAKLWHKKAADHYPCAAEDLKKIDNRATKLARLGIVTSVGAPSASEVMAMANAGDVASMRRLAQYYMVGFDTIRADSRQALAWYIKAAQKGDGEAMLAIGNAFQTGLGVVQSKEKAEQWWRRAAKAGNKQALQMLSVDSSIIEKTYRLKQEK